MSAGYPSVAAADRALAAAKAKALGHEISVYRVWLSSDEAEVHAECKCGWRSQLVSAGYHAAQLGDRHLAEAGAA